MPTARRSSTTLPPSLAGRARYLDYCLLFFCSLLFFVCSLFLCAYCVDTHFSVLIVIVHYRFPDTLTAVLLVARRRRNHCIIGRVTGKVFIAISLSSMVMFSPFFATVLVWAGFRLILLFLRVWAGNWSGTSRIGQECACPSGPHGQKLYLIPFFVITISLAQIELPDSHSSTFVSLYLFITMSRHPPIRACFLRLYLSRGQAPVVTTWQA